MGDIPSVHLFNLVRLHALSAINRASNRDKTELQKLFDLADSIAKSWFNPTKCSYPACDEQSIKNSHTIQAAALKQAFGQDLFSPTWDNKTASLTVKKTSAAKSSIFPGYCTQHENMFEFERSIQLENNRDNALQAMRTLHREAWLVESRISFSDAIEGLAKKILAVDKNSRYLADANRRKLESVQKACFDFKLLQHTMAARVTPTLTRLENFVKESSPANPPWLFVTDIPRQGFAFLATVKLGNQLGTLISMTMLPNSGKSRVIATVEVDFDDLLPEYTRAYLSDKTIINTMREFIEKGTLDWYAGSSWWESLPESDRQSIESSLSVF